MKPNEWTSNLMMGGIKPFARSLDHVGPIARTVADLRVLFDSMQEPHMRENRPHEILTSKDSPARLGRPRGYFDDRADSEVKRAFDQTVADLAAAGATIIEIEDPINFEQIINDHRRIMASEAAVVHSDWWDEFPDDYPPRIQELILEGRSLRAIGYIQAEHRRRESRIALEQAIYSERLQGLITPATVSTAPDPFTTGDPAFNSPWSFIGDPTVSFPTGLSADGLPVALQLVGNALTDLGTLRVAQWCEHAIRNRHQ